VTRRVLSVLRSDGWRAAPSSLRYLLVGALCALLNNLLLIAVVTLGLNYLTGVLAVCGPMLVIGYALHAAITFERPARLGDFLRYSLGILAGYPLWIAALFLFCDLLAMPIYLGAPASALLLFIANCLSTHWAIARSVRGAFDFRARRNLDCC